MYKIKWTAIDGGARWRLDVTRQIGANVFNQRKILSARDATDVSIASRIERTAVEQMKVAIMEQGGIA